MRSKKGLELSINFIVVLIIAIAVFSMGLIFLRTLSTQANVMKDDITAQTQKQLERMLDDGSKVAIAQSTKTVSAGDSVIFPVGVLNLVGSDATFKIIATQGPATTDNKNPITGVTLEMLSPSDLTLQNNEHSYKRIVAKVPSSAIKGTYVVNIDVSCSPSPPCPGGSYDGYTHKAYIKVK